MKTGKKIGRRFVSAVLCAGLAVSLAGCVPKGGVPVTSEGPVSLWSPYGSARSSQAAGATSAADGEYYDAGPNGWPAFLSDELGQLYMDGQAIYLNFFSLEAGMGFDQTGGYNSAEPDYTDENGNGYMRAVGPLAKWDDFVAYVEAVFVDFDTLNGAKGPHYIEVGGYVHYMPGGRGSDVTWVKDVFEPGSQSDTRVEFNVVGLYTPDGSAARYDDSPSFADADLVAEPYPIVLVMTDGGWRIDTFTITY